MANANASSIFKSDFAPALTIDPQGWVERNRKAFEKLRAKVSSLDTCKHLEKCRVNTDLGQYLLTHLPRQGERFVDCGEKQIAVVCKECDTVLVARASCHLRICKRCMERKAIQYKRRVKDQLQKLGQLRFVTLTLPKHVTLDRKAVDDIRKAFNKWKKHPAIKPLLGPHVYFLEATPKPDGWHLHIHVLAAGKYIPHALLKKTWFAITGASIVHVTARGSTDNLLNECFKYCLKGGRINDPKDVVTFLVAFKDVRMFQPCAGLHPMPKQDGQLVCPKCHAIAWRRSYPGELYQAYSSSWRMPTLHPSIESLIIVWPP